MNEKSV